MVTRARANEALMERLRRLQAQMGQQDPFGAGQVRSAGSLADQPRALGEIAARSAGNVLAGSGLGRVALGAGQLAQATPDLLRLLAGVATAPTGPNQPVESALAASEAGMGAGMEPTPGAPAPAGYHRMPDGTLMPGDAMPAQAPLGAPANAASMPPTPPGGYTHGVTQVLNPAVPESGGGLGAAGAAGGYAGGVRQVLNPAVAEGMGPSPDDLRRQYAGGAGGLPPMSTGMAGQRIDTTPGVAGSLSRVDDITSSYSPRRILGMPGQTAAGLPLPSTLGRTGLGGLSPEAIETLPGNPSLAADILNQQRGRSPQTDMWARKEQGDAVALQELFPLFEDPNDPNNDAEQTGYLQRGIEGRRQPGGRLDFRGALLAKLGDEAGSGDVLDSLGIPMDMTPDQVPGAASRAAQLVGKVQIQGGRLPALAAARAQRVQDEITRQHVLSLQSGEAFGQPQIAAIIRALA